jgi:uncharacterized membrane protein YoaK (UPF0700 family)
MAESPKAISDSTELSQLEGRLPPLLAVIAGMVDVIGFLSFGLFTAHITGNLVVITARLVRGQPPHVAQVLAVPIFVIAVAALWWIAKALRKRGRALTQPLLLIQFLLLTLALILSVIYSPTIDPPDWMSVVIAMIAVSSIACQFALLRLSVQVAPTAVMTGNLTNATLSLLDTLSRSQPLMKDAAERLRTALKLVGGFFAGCVAGAAAVSWLGNWSWSFPAVLAGVAVALGRSRNCRPIQ